MSEDSEQVLSQESAEVIENLIAYILNNASNKLPIKLSDLNEICGKNSRKTKWLLDTMTEKLSDTYGIIFEEVPRQKSMRKFICYSEYPTYRNYDKEQGQHMVLLFIILSYIFMSEKFVYETELESFLKGLKIYFDRDHEYFGANIKQLVTETFVKQLYLHKEKSESEFDTEVKYVYSWGFRADKEFPKKKLLQTTAEANRRSFSSHNIKQRVLTDIIVEIDAP